MHRHIRWLPLGLLLGLLACAHATPTPAPTPGTRYDFRDEGTVPAPPAVAVSPTRQGRATAATPSATEVAAMPPAGTASGWRVQVFAGASPEIARATQVELQRKVPEMVYVDYIAPYYKVRVGDCPDRPSCEALQRRLQAMGNESAWVVPSTIQP